MVKSSPLNIEENRVYTVTRLTRDIKAVLEGTFQDVWVEGEISNFTVSSAGHAYFSMKDENSLINCVLFKSSGMTRMLDIEDGMKVLSRGRISVYDKRGQYQLYVNKLEPVGRGSLQLAFENLKKKLYEEGIFSEEHKKPIPFLPVRIGVVTSPSGAAIRDILNVVRRRFSNVEVTIYPVRVQGEEASREIAEAIFDLNVYNESLPEEENPIDVIIAGRGGGSLEDLWPFNEEVVARAIYDSKIPVISAVGHEVDYTIADFVADLRASTPSAAAELVIPVRSELEERLKEIGKRAEAAVRDKIKRLERELIILKDSYVLRAPENVFLQLEQQVDDMVRAATEKVKHYIEIKGHRLAAVTGKMDVMSPLAVLERGYSITFAGGKTVRDIKELTKGDIIRTRLSFGEVDSIVEIVHKPEDN